MWRIFSFLKYPMNIRTLLVAALWIALFECFSSSVHAQGGGNSPPNNSIEFFRDDSLRTDDDALLITLDDWPSVGAKSRSPKYLFAKQDNIMVRAMGTVGLGNSRLTLKVASQSDVTGITFALTENSPGVYINKFPSKPLRLGDTSSVGSAFAKIKVVNREILVFTIFEDGVITFTRNIMVAKAKFAGAGIPAFWVIDRPTVRTEAITNTAFFDAGDGFSDPRLGIKYAGANNPNQGQASFYHFTSHGQAQLAPGSTTVYWGNGNLVDENGTLIIDPSASSGIVNSTDWNMDVKWVVLDTCFNIDHRGAGGRGKWWQALQGTPNPAHGVLGAWDAMDADIHAHLQRFWELLRTQTSAGVFTKVPTAYQNALEQTNPPQPWAMMYHASNGTDEVKFMTQDDPSSGMTYSYVSIYPLPSYGKSIGNPVTEADVRFDENRGVIRNYKARAAEFVNLAEQNKLLGLVDLSRKKPPFASKSEKRQDDAIDFTGEQPVHAKSSLSSEAAVKLAMDEIGRSLPEIHQLMKVASVGTRTEQQFNSAGVLTSDITTGYMIHFKVMAGGLPVHGDYVLVSIYGDKIGNLVAKAHIQPGDMADGQRVKILALGEALNKCLFRLKEDLGVKSNYEITEYELVYYRARELEGKADLTPTECIPAWRVKINPAFVDGKPGVIKEVWIDAVTGQYLGLSKSK